MKSVVAAPSAVFSPATNTTATASPIEKVRKNAKVVKTESTPKRKKIVLNFIQKVEVLEKLKSGIRVVDLAKEYNIGLSTVCDIRKYGDEKLLQFRKDHLLSMTRKTFKAPDFPLLDKALRIWVYQERTKNYILSDAIFAAKALEFFKELYPDSKKTFKASYGYVDKFCKRYEISLRNEPSKMYADLSKLDAFILDFHSLNYSPEQIYSADEGGLNFEEMPIVNESKQKLTLMLCCNSSGKHRLPMVLVNNTPNPSCFQIDDGVKKRQIDKTTLPIHYAHSSKAWMTLEIFEEWFHEEFVPKVRAHLASLNQEEKAVLLIDNCPAHPMKLESSDGKIKGLFLPPESSSLIMPMNQGPIAYLKRKYRTNLLRNSVLEKNFLKNYNVKQAIYALANLWRELPDDLLMSSWHKLKTNLNVKYNYEAIDMQEIRTNFNKLGVELSDHIINCWLDTDYGDAGYGFLADHEIIEQTKRLPAPVLTNVTLNDEMDDSQIQNESIKIIPAKMAFTHCTELMQWLEVHHLSKAEDLISMQRIKELAARNLVIDEMATEFNSANSALNNGSNLITNGDTMVLNTYLDNENVLDTIPNGTIPKLNESNSDTKSITTFLDEEVPKLNESNSEIDKSLTTFLDEENTGNVMRLEGSNIEKKCTNIISKAT